MKVNTGLIWLFGVAWMVEIVLCLKAKDMLAERATSIDSLGAAMDLKQLAQAAQLHDWLVVASGLALLMTIRVQTSKPWSKWIIAVIGAISLFATLS